jgi:hypothetical protein
VRIAIVENLENTRLGPLGRALDEAGAEVEWFRSCRTAPVRGSTIMTA